MSRSRVATRGVFVFGRASWRLSDHVLASKDIDGFEFKGTPINESLVRDLAGGDFIAQQRNVVLVGGTGTGKTHLAMAIARACIRAGSRGRFFNTVDLVNRLEAEGRTGRQGRLAFPSCYLNRCPYCNVQFCTNRVVTPTRTAFR